MHWYNEKRPWKHMLHALGMTVVFVLAVTIFSNSRAVGTYLASDLLGQFVPTRAVVTPIFTSGGGGSDVGFSDVLSSVAVDTVNHRLFVSDSTGNRVLVFNLSAGNSVNDYIADFVFGQTTFTGSSPGTTATTLSAPRSLAFDSTNNRLFVSDTGNNRVLVYDTASIANGESAVNVLGATDFVTDNNSPGQGFIGAPDGLALDTNGYLYVSGTANSSSNTGTRVLVFDVRPSGAGAQALCGESTSGIVNGMDASCVIGQADFDSFATGPADTYFANGGMYGLSIDTVNNRLFVNDAGRNRVLVFNLATITNGDLSVNIPMNVLGQSTLLGTSPALGASHFNTPEGSWYDSATGMLFVAESGNNRVSVFDARPSGSGSQSLCGVPGTGIADGMDASCVIGQPYLHAPRGVYVASSYVFITDSNNRRIALFDFSTPANNPTISSVVGVISEVVSIGTNPQWTSNAINSNVVYNSLAYMGKKSAVGFETPSDVILDTTHHRLFVADTANNRVLFFNLDTNDVLVDHTADGVIGQTDFLEGGASAFFGPSYMAYDEAGDRLFVVDATQSFIYVFNVGADVMTPVYTIGDGDPFTVDANAVTGPKGIAYDPDTQILYVAHYYANRVALYDVRANGSPAITMCGVTSTGIADAMNASCVIGQVDFNNLSTGLNDHSFDGVNGITLDTANDRLFVTDDNQRRVLVFDTSTFVDGAGTNGDSAINVIGAADFTTQGSATPTASSFSGTSRLAYDATLGKLFVSDVGNNRVLVFDASPSTIADGADAEAVIGQSDFTSSGSSTTQGDLHTNTGITFDPTSRRLYVADSANNRVMMFDTIIFDPSITTTLPVTGGTPFSTTLPTLQDQGTVSYALVSGALPTGLSLDGSGITGTPSADGVYNFTLQAVDTYTGGVVYSPTLAFTYTVTGTPSGTTAGGGSSSGTGVVIIPPPGTTTGTTGTGTTGTTGTTTTGTTTSTTTGTTTAGSSSTSGTSGSGATGTGTAPGTTTSGGTGTIPTNPTTGGTTGGASTGTSTGSNPPPTSGGCPGNILNTIVCIVEDSVDYTEGVLVDTTGQIRGIITEPAGDIISKLIGIVGILAGALFTLLPVLFANPLSFSELLLIPARLWSLLLIAFGLKKRNRPWGRVYDSVTKQPLDPVYVSLQNNEGKEVASSITDIDGRYGFLVEPGMYRMIPKKTHYSFPSAKLIGKTRDELYLDLYFGYIFEVKEAGEVITKNIPMDPDTFDWNEFAKQEQTLMRFYSKRDRVFARIADVAFSVGLTVSTIALIVAPITYNIVIFSLYIVMLVIKEVGFRQRSSGIVVRKGTDLPVPFAIMRVLSSKTKVEVLHKVTNTLGRYYALVGNGTYDVTIETKNLDGSYSLAMKKENIEIKDGLLKQKFEV